MACVLEGISAQFGSKYGKTFAKNLGLRKQDLLFFLAHSELDSGHAHDILEVLDQTNLTDFEWARMAHVATTTGFLYKQIYNASVA